MYKIFLLILISIKLFSLELKIECDQVINNGVINICYNYSAKSPNYVKYKLSPKSNTKQSIKKRPRFYRDKHIPKKYSVSPNDYIYVTDSKTKKLNFDRSHLAPDADFDYDYKTLLKVYTMANIVAMRSEVNRGIWLEKEERERSLVSKYNNLNIISGALYEDNDLFLVKKDISEIIKLKEKRYHRKLSNKEIEKITKKYKKYDRKLRKKHILIPTKLFKIIKGRNFQECYLVDNLKNKLISDKCNVVLNIIEN